MNWRDLQPTVKQIVDFSTIISNSIRNDDTLFDQLESLSDEAKKKLYEEYKDSSGPVLTIRKKVVTELVSGKINRKSIISQFRNGKKNSPKSFSQYKNLFSVLYPFLIT